MISMCCTCILIDFALAVFKQPWGFGLGVLGGNAPAPLQTPPLCGRGSSPPRPPSPQKRQPLASPSNEKIT